MKSYHKLEIVHSEVCYPFEVKLLGGNCYFLTYIDEFTIYMQIYPLDKKGEMFTNFKRFKSLAKK